LTGDIGREDTKWAQSNLELARLRLIRALVDFEQKPYSDAEQFNLQKAQVAVAGQIGYRSQMKKWYEVTKQRFLIGKIAILELNNADTKKTRTGETIFRLCRKLLELLLQYP